MGLRNQHMEVTQTPGQDDQIDATDGTGDKIEDGDATDLGSDDSSGGDGGAETEVSSSSTDETDETKAEAGRETDYTKKEQADIEKFMQQLKLPKEIKYFRDEKDGSLKFVVPVNGKRFTATPEQIFRGFGVNQAGFQRMSEAKKLENNINNFFEGLKKNPKELWAVADSLGINKYELAEMLLSEKLDEMKLTPEERAYREEKRRRELLEEENETYKKTEEQRRLRDVAEVEQEKLDKELVSAMKKHGIEKKVPNAKSQILTAAIGKMMLAHQYEQELTADDAVFLALQDWQEFVQDSFNEIPPELAIEKLPKTVIDAIRKADIAKLKESSRVAPTALSSPDESQFGQEIDLGEGEPMEKQRNRRQTTITDYFRNLR